MTGRRITRTKEQRVDDLEKAINRSGFTCLEVLQILANWYTAPITVFSAGIEHEIVPERKSL